MASLTTRGSRFYIDVYDASRSPKRKRLSLKTTDKDTANELLGRLTRAYRLGDWDPWTESVSDFFDRPKAVTILSEAVDAFLTAKRDDVSRHTMKLYTSDVRSLCRFVGPQKTVEKVKAEEIRDWLRSNDVKRSTQRKRYGVISTFFTWLKANGHTSADPLKRVQRPTKPPNLPRACLPDDLRRICGGLIAEYITQRRSATPPPIGGMVWHVDLWHFLLYSGFRIREAARLRWKHVHFDRGVIDLHEQKSGKAGTAVLGSKAQAVLESIAESRPHRSPNEYVFSAPHTRCESRNIDSFCIHRGQTFKRFRERVIPDRKLTTHSLRHGFCTLLAKAGCSAYQIKEAARHANVSTSERYVSLAKTDVRAAVNGAL